METLLQLFEPNHLTRETRFPSEKEFNFAGFAKKDLHIELVGDQYLLIKGENDVRTRSYHMFIPDGTDIDNISATFKNGLLSIICPKKEGKVIEIKSG